MDTSWSHTIFPDQPTARRGRRQSSHILSWPLPALVYGDLNAGGYLARPLRSLAPFRDTQEIDEQPLDQEGGWPLPGEVPTGRQSFFIVTKKTAHLSGWRLGLVMTSLGLGVFLTTLEATIISTSLITIIRDLGREDIAGWINTSYLLSLAGVMVVAAKLSDIFGPKRVMTISLFIVSVAAAACGSAQSMQQLIIFRVFQGIGAAGIDSMYQIILRHMVPIAQYPIYGGAIAMIFIGSMAVGPLLGGFINDHSTWRWAFWMVVPVGSISLALLILCLPSQFPHQHERRHVTKPTTPSVLRRLDIIGAFLMIAIPATLVFALEEGGNQYNWNSAVIIVALVMSAVLAVLFTFWEKQFKTYFKGAREPVFPWRLATNRFFMGLVINSFLTGFGFMSAVIEIPQKFQLVNGLIPSKAAVRLLPFVLCTPVAAVLSGWVVSRQSLPHIYILFVGSALSTVGMVLMTTLSVEDFDINPAQYFYQVLLGLGFGATMSALPNVTTAYTDARDLAVAVSAVNQFRFLGGAVGLAMCSAILNHQTKNITSGTGMSQSMGAGEQSTIVDNNYEFKHAYSTGYHSQMYLLACSCALSLLVLLLIVEKRPRKYILEHSE